MKKRSFNRGFRKYRSPAYLLALGLISFAVPSTAATVALDFACISHNSAASCAAGEQQLRVALAQSAPDKATFTFTNVGNRASVIGRLYFEDRKGLLHSSGKPDPKHGINNGTGNDLESLSVNFLSGYFFASLRSALASGELRLGAHVQEFDGGFSESYVGAPAAAVPVPETVWLFATGLFGFVGIARRRREQPAPASADNN